MVFAIALIAVAATALVFLALGLKTYGLTVERVSLRDAIAEFVAAGGLLLAAVGFALFVATVHTQRLRSMINATARAYDDRALDSAKSRVDPETQLLSASGFAAELTSQLRAADRDRTRYSVTVIRLERLASQMAPHGRAEFIAAVDSLAERLIARSGGDAILGFNGDTALWMGLPAGCKLVDTLTAFDDPLALASGTFDIEAAIGISEFPEHSRCRQRLCDLARQAAIMEPRQSELAKEFSSPPVRLHRATESNPHAHNGCV